MVNILFWLFIGYVWYIFDISNLFWIINLSIFSQINFIFVYSIFHIFSFYPFFRHQHSRRKIGGRRISDNCTRGLLVLKCSVIKTTFDCLRRHFLFFISFIFVLLQHLISVYLYLLFSINIILILHYLWQAEDWLAKIDPQIVSMNVTRQAASIVLQSADDLVIKFIDEGARTAIYYSWFCSVLFCSLFCFMFYIHLFMSLFHVKIISIFYSFTIISEKCIHYFFMHSYSILFFIW